MRDLPVGCIFNSSVESPLQKYFASPVGQIISTDSRHPVPHRGAYRDRHERGMGCGGRGSVLRAMESQGGFLGTCERSPASGREMLQRTAKSCGPDARRWRQVLRSCVGPTGLRQNLSADDGGKRARSPGRARHKLLKPLRAGTSGDSGVLVVTRVRSTTTIAHETAGALGIRRSPRPLWAEDLSTPRALRVARSRVCICNCGKPLHEDHGHKSRSPRANH
jgi:hypothetical protein